MSDVYNSFFEKILRNFADVFTGQRPSFISRACGRVELIGGHTDYNEGFIIAAAMALTVHELAAADSVEPS